MNTGQIQFVTASTMVVTNTSDTICYSFNSGFYEYRSDAICYSFNSGCYEYRSVIFATVLPVVVTNTA